MNKIQSSRWGKASVALVAIAAALAVAMLTIVRSSDSAEAQPTDVPVVGIAAYNAMPGEDGLNVAVTVDPGSETVGAVTGTVNYDADLLKPVGCETFGSIGACNEVDDGLRFAIASVEGLSDISDLVDITFDVSGEVGDSPLEVVLDEFVDLNLADLDVTIADGSVTIDLPGTGAVTGVISNSDGLPLYDIEVCAAPSDGTEPVCVITNLRGEYRIDDLATNAYAISAADQAGAYLEALASQVGITTDEITTGIDLILDQASAADAGSPAAATGDTGSIVGTVTSNGQAVMAAQVCASQPVLNIEECTLSQRDGSFRLDGLGTSNYWVSAKDLTDRLGESEKMFLGVVAPETRNVDLTLGG